MATGRLALVLCLVATAARADRIVLKAGGEVVGAIDCSGGKPDQDHAVAGAEAFKPG